MARTQRIGLDAEERDTILAALRYWQNRGSRHQPMEELENIATNDGTHSGLGAEAIDELCERINCG